MINNTTSKQETKNTNSVLKHGTRKKSKKNFRSVSAKQDHKKRNLHRRSGVTHTSTGGHVYRGKTDTSFIQFESPSFYGFNLQPGKFIGCHSNKLAWQ